MKRILHATDFGPDSARAFEHALRIAINARAKLYLLHVSYRDQGDSWADIHHVRDPLGSWGVFESTRPTEAIEIDLGVHIAKLSVHAADFSAAVAQFAVEHEIDLLVLWTHDRSGAARLLRSPPHATEIARSAGVQTLFLPGAAPGFIDPASGRSNLASVLIPVDGEKDCAAALSAIAGALHVIAPDIPLQFLHVGETPPDLPFGIGDGRHDLLVRQGPVVQTIVSVAREIGAGMIAMPTAGRHGMFDALRGSTSERVLREAGVPILAAPI